MSAEQDCSNIFGPYGGLVSIETIEEWDFLKEMLEMYGSGNEIKKIVCRFLKFKFNLSMLGTYWTSGKYDLAINDWIWSTNNQPIISSPPWSAGHPSTPNLILRIQIFHTNRYDASWRTMFNTQLHRYICEVRKIN